MSLIVTSDGVDPETGSKVEFYRAAGAEAARLSLWGMPVIKSRFPILARVEQNLHVLPEEFDRFEQEALRLAAESADVAKQLGWEVKDVEPLKRYATACIDAMEFARKYNAEEIWYC